MAKVGRNDPCPCGSGKKYKRCCLSQTAAPPADLLWRRLRAIDDEQTHQLLKHAARLYDDEGIEAAWADYAGGDLDDFHPDSPHNQAFFPWYLYNWRPDTADVAGELAGLTIAESYLKRYGKRLSDLERSLIGLIANAPYSFHEVVTCEPGQGYRLRDVLLDQEVEVMEQAGSQMCQPGDLLFGRVIQVDHVGLMMGCGSTLMPPASKASIIALRRRMREKEDKLTRETLEVWARDIRQLYFTIDDELHAPPEIRNAEGDPISLHELYFEIESPEAAFDGLKRLAPGVRKADLLRDAEFDRAGHLQALEFPWLERGRGQESASGRRVLGHLRIEGSRLIASVDSRARAERIRSEIEGRLGDQVRYQVTDIQSLSAMLRDAPGASDEADDAHLLAQPEGQAEVEQMLAAHWHRWVEMKLPALEGQSPMEAVQHEDGRDMVVVLLDDMERREQRQSGRVSQQPYIEWARAHLGLQGRRS